MGRHPVAIVAVLAMAAAACTGGGAPMPSPPSHIRTPSPTPEPPRGGEITIGVEGWPECLNPILSCAQPITHQTVLYHVLPRAMEFAPDGSLVASPLLVEAPTLGNGGLTQAPFTVTYRIRSEAVWDDGSPITSEDFALTWRAILHTRDSALAGDYRRILAVDTPDPKTAILRFGERFAGWPELFGGSKGFILKAAAFPDADPEAPNIHQELLFDIPFSGGPFRLVEWSTPHPGSVMDSVLLERNEKYFGPRAFLDRVTFVPLFDLAAEGRALLEGQVDVISPSAEAYARSGTSALDVAPEIVDVRAADGPAFEALWFPILYRPLQDHLVREALMYAIDRQRVVDQLISLYSLRPEVLNCGFLALPHVGPWCRSRPFQRFAYDPTRSLALLEEAGFDCSTVPCTRAGDPLVIEYFTDSTNALETKAQEILIDRALASGFQLKPITFGSGALFGRPLCPSVGVMTQCTVPVPSDAGVTSFFACDAIPREANAHTGLNRIEWCNREADRLLKESDQELDPAKRLELLERLYELQAEDLIGLPLYSVPAIVTWRIESVAGRIDRYLSSPYGPFFNIFEWHRPTP
jgi:peptide/nickel transport system substrate-binding protein